MPEFRRLGVAHESERKNFPDSFKKSYNIILKMMSYIFTRKETGVPSLKTKEHYKKKKIIAT